MSQLVFCCPNNEKNNVFHFCKKRSPYWALAILRIVLTFIPQTGYIHPDEYFQFIEVAAGDSFDIDVYRPWEFNISFPVRNSLFPQVCVRFPYLILDQLSPYVETYFGFTLNTPYFLVLFPRILMTLLSFVCDCCLYKICVILNEPYLVRMTLFASSYIMFTYCTRTFSNSIEMVLTSVLIYYVSRCMEFSNKVVLQSDYLTKKYYKAKNGVERTKIYKLRMTLPSHSLNDCLLLATITVVGIFNRPTFVAYAFSPIFFWLQRGLGSISVGFLDFHIRIFTFIVFGIPTALALILYDSMYFKYLTMEEIGKFEISMNNFVVTPLNFVKYNSMSDNLKNHGLHPRFLHFIVNVPLLFSILGILSLLTCIKMFNSGLKGKWLELPRIQSVESLMFASYVVPVLVLSIFPHQEPRFIIPALLPIIFLFSHNIKSPTVNVINVTNNAQNISSREVKKKNSKMLYFWYVSNVLLTIFYGFIHQGGILPVASHLAKELKSKPDLTHVYYMSSHSYPLPTGILQLRNTGRTYTSNTGHKYKLTKDFHFSEMGSKDVDIIVNEIVSTLRQCEENWESKNIPYRFYYALPTSFLVEFTQYVSRNNSQQFTYKIYKEFSPHISLEKPPTTDILWQYLKPRTMLDFNDPFQQFVTLVSNYSSQFSLTLLQIEHPRIR
ncbi:GPI mannosyltransferase 4 [Trichogramma pretiosum]|uniref:GPI mannosyltransferase 4 n=1 Tax=Trichogramma pretiosum TaxID=7493 RepID=UPI0006C94654|nr:GPI mannosyltransferase 4 [Trichogramma pretiosum]